MIPPSTGCLLETSLPIGPPKTHPKSPEAGPLAAQPILPSSIVSSSFQGVVLMDYEPKGEDELRLRVEEEVRVL